MEPVARQYRYLKNLVRLVHNKRVATYASRRVTYIAHSHEPSCLASLCQAPLASQIVQMQTPDCHPSISACIDGKDERYRTKRHRCCDRIHAL
jgi:hypothetical protein